MTLLDYIILLSEVLNRSINALMTVVTMVYTLVVVYICVPKLGR